MLPIIKKHEVVLEHSFKTWPYACFKQVPAQEALQRHNDNLQKSDAQIDSKVPIRLQAGHFCKISQVLREMKRNSTSGIRQDPVVKKLLDLILVSGTLK